ncbi:MAG: RHS domain-containing protein [Polyangiaceae bacterium]|nr:RHS domain-containing protein [Polyangiaceae bacterium]
MQAAKWFDPVLGIDIHMVLVPAPPSPTPIPTPLPHPFVGIVFDPLGAALGAALGLAFGGGGPVLLYGAMPAGNTGTEVKALPPHFPTPPGISFAPMDIPGNEGTIVTGSKTVTFAGSSEGRLLSMVMTCNYPINLPTSLCMAIPLGGPILIGGPDSFDVLAALTQAIRTKWFSNFLITKLKAGPRLSRVICFLTGHPVDVMTGEVLTDAVDFELPGPMPLKFERFYYSRNRREGPLGPGWHHPLDSWIDDRDEGVVVCLPDGRERLHPRLDEGVSVWDPIDRYWLERTERGYRLTMVDGKRYHYESVKRGKHSFVLVRITDRSDNGIVLKYDDGILRNVIDSAGRELHFFVSHTGRIERIRSHALGIDLLRFSYDAEGKLASATDAEGNTLRYAYRGGVLVQETNRNGLSFYFEYDWYDPDGWCVRTWGDGGIYDHRMTYDKLRNVTLVDDSRGGRTHYFGNPAGLVDREIDPTGREKCYEWDEFYRKTAEIDGAGNRTEWEYDERGNKIVERDALGQEKRWKYNRFDSPVEFIDEAGGQWIRELDDEGKPTLAVDPLGNAYRFWYERRGLPSAVADPKGRRFALKYDEAGNLAETVDWEGHVTRHEYDGLGRIIATTDALGERTEFTWDLRGRLRTVTQPDGSRIELVHDGEGNLVEWSDSLGRIRHYQYAGLGKRVREVDPAGGITQYFYDTEENLVRIVNAAGAEYRIDVDLAGRVVKETGFDGVVTQFRHDRAGRCIERVRGGHKRMSIAYDKLGRVKAQVFPGGLRHAYEYDARGGLVAAQNGACTVKRAYDGVGNLIEERVGDHVVESQYDEVGLRKSRRTSAGDEVAYDVNGNGFLRGISVGLPGQSPRLTTMTRNPVGYEIARLLPGAIACEWSRGTGGRAELRSVKRRNTEITSTKYDWRPNGTLAATLDPFQGRTIYEHDSRSYLVSATFSDGTSQFRSADAIGNIYRTRERTDRNFTASGALLRSGDVTFKYDDEGQLVEKILANGTSWRYVWDGAGQLSRVVRPDGVEVTFAYDALGRRIRKTVGERSTTYVWDKDELAHELQNDGSKVAWVFDPGTFVPLAKIEGNAYFGILGDHLGAPTALVDEAGEIAWQAQLDLYGVAKSDVSRTSCPWRFPGQYEDEETGLYYNRFRYYDPDSGIYISQDPLGLAFDLNLYAYVADPLSWIDPFGLGKCRGGQAMPDIPRGNPAAGWDHIFQRHVPGFGANQGDLFRLRPGSTAADIERQLERAMGQVWHSGQRISDPNRIMQTFEKRMTINGMSARYRMVVDTANNRIVTFFPALGG